MTGDMKQLATVFFTVLLAEMGDKTQIATLLFATEQRVGRLGVFFAAAAALVTSSAIAVAAGSWVTKMIPGSTLKAAAGIGFIAIGIWTLIARS
jgi:putative Ca2+/H+ antiporter (TMEM165/GDT1 family)